MDRDRDAYGVLQVSSDALPVVIKAAYRALARIYHADGTAPDLTRMMAINRAYELLRDPDRRRRYDLERARATVRSIPVGSPKPTASPTSAHVPPPTGPSFDPSSPMVDFGRYAGWRIADLARVDPDYVRWLARHSSGIRFRDAIRRAMPNDRDLHDRSRSTA